MLLLTTNLSKISGVLNPAQVIDLSDQSMEEALNWCRLISPVQSQILIAGGDGTIG